MSTLRLALTKACASVLRTPKAHVGCCVGKCFRIHSQSTGSKDVKPLFVPSND